MFVSCVLRVLIRTVSHYDIYDVDTVVLSVPFVCRDISELEFTK